MTSDITPAGASELERVRDLPTDALRAELADALGGTARSLLRLATIWRELEARGEDLSDLRSGIGVYLPAIAAGTVLPEVVVKYSGQPTLLRAVSALTPDAQRALLAGGAVPLVVRSEGGYTRRMLPAHALTATQVRQVFGERSVRTEDEQVALLTGAPARAPKSGRAAPRGRVRAEPAKGSIRFGRVSVPAADVVAALADLRGTEPLGADPENVVAVKLTDDEKKRLAHAAIEGNTSQQDLVRKALRAGGLI